jgi:hypothetical protein
MAPLGTEYSMPDYEMMARLGISPGEGVLPQLGMRYATALRRCENCHSKSACRHWFEIASDHKATPTHRCARL